MQNRPNPNVRILLPTCTTRPARSIDSIVTPSVLSRMSIRHSRTQYDLFDSLKDVTHPTKNMMLRTRAPAGVPHLRGSRPRPPSRNSLRKLPTTKTKPSR